MDLQISRHSQQRYTTTAFGFGLKDTHDNLSSGLHPNRFQSLQHMYVPYLSCTQNIKCCVQIVERSGLCMLLSVTSVVEHQYCLYKIRLISALMWQGLNKFWCFMKWRNAKLTKLGPFKKKRGFKKSKLSKNATSKFVLLIQ